ncbi:MAG TPA: hypothetical protein DCS29_04205 [Candidatus Magasanikbacteria bacterium]|nr:MAG: hypothetical protein A2479_02370 [Candidatus Magasanikbacteria bacterium RIFOXYC2_FULL_39_8]HAT03944.1 hypothetical protein [Candidatus Magasanikbacteria bacterium]
MPRKNIRKSEGFLKRSPNEMRTSSEIPQPDHKKKHPRQKDVFLCLLKAEMEFANEILLI